MAGERVQDGSAGDLERNGAGGAGGVRDRVERRERDVDRCGDRGIRGDAGGRVDAAEDAASGDNRRGGGAHDGLPVAGVPMKEQRS